MPPSSPAEYLALAQDHLKRVQAAWPDPADWSDLAMYGLYALEAATLAAAKHFNLPIKKTHWDKIDRAHDINTKHGLPDVADLLQDLNTARKARAYGEDQGPEELGLDAEQVAISIEQFIEEVAKVVQSGTP